MSRAYYNEIDPFAAQWLRNLIQAGHIAPGDVDERSIEDVTPNDLQGYTQCHFFAGIGVWSYALRRAGWPDNKPVWTGSCPCQPFSAAGKSGGFDDERHLWPAFFHLIQQCKPATVFGEQVSSKDGLGWFDLVQTDLEGADYSATALDLCAAGVGAPHIRQRLFWVANSRNQGLQGYKLDRDNCRKEGWKEEDGYVGASGVVDRLDGEFAGDCKVNGVWAGADWVMCRDGKRRPIEPGTFPLANGIANRVGRVRAYGNAINAEAAKVFIESYLEVSSL